MKQIKVRKRTAEAERSGRRLRKTGPPPEMTRDPVTSEEKQTGRVEVSDSFKDTDPRMQLGRRGGGGFGGEVNASSSDRDLEINQCTPTSLVQEILI